MVSQYAILVVVLDSFTDQARQVVVLAQEEARLMRHSHVGTEHLLVGLARVGDADATALLREHGLTGEQVRAEVVGVVGVGEVSHHGQTPFTPAAHDALEATLHEALSLGQDRVQPAHLLLAIMRQPDALARRILASVGANPPDIRAELIQRLSEHHEPPPPRPPVAAPVRLGDSVIGEVGRPHVDGRLLLEILARRGAVAAWLHEHGVDEHAVRQMLGEG